MEPLAGSGDPPRRSIVWRYLSRFDDGEVARWAFRGLLVGAIGVLALDLKDLVERNGGLMAPDNGQVTEAPVLEPLLPPVREGDEAPPDPRPFLTTDQERLRAPIAFTLGAGGVLDAVGTIDRGAANRFRTEIDARGEYVRTVRLDSPGGSLDDALAISSLIHEKDLSTEVADGALCASSCPIVLAGGTRRKVGDKAAVGVHQFYAMSSGAPRGAAEAMSDAQATTARITRHLSEMKVDPALWLHALETPPQSLYYFSAEELRTYGLVTPGEPLAAQSR